MNEIAHALANLINDWGWLLILGFVLGGGEVSTRALDGRRKNTKLQAQLAETKSRLDATKSRLDATKEENDRLHTLLTTATNNLALGGTGGTDTAELLSQARNAVDDRARAMDLLSQVLAADMAYPQLPEQIRTDIEAMIETHRARLSNGDHTPAQ